MPLCGFALLRYLFFPSHLFPTLTDLSCLVCPFRCVKVRSLYFSGMCGRSILLNVLSFIQIDPSFIIYSTHPTLLCLWRAKHATRFAFFHSIQSSICIHDILPICGMRTAEGRSMLMDVLFFVQIDPFIIM